MGRSKIPGLREASVKEVRELSKLAWVRDEALSDRIFEARILPDGRVLQFIADGEKANLYPSRASAEEVHREYLEGRRKEAEQRAKGKFGFNPSVDLLPPIADFLRDVEAIAKSLGPRLRIPDEALDGTLASLDAVDKALRRIPWAKRPVPDLVTPLVAYVGEVMRRVSGGSWTRSPTTQTIHRKVEEYDPAEQKAYQAAIDAARVAGRAAAQRAEVEAKARGASKEEVAAASSAALSAEFDEIRKNMPKPIRVEEFDETITEHENEPMIRVPDGRLWDPLALVYVPMIEPCKRLPLRLAVETTLVSR